MTNAKPVYTFTGHWPKVLGHRGVSHSAPENTLAAFQACSDLNIAGFECDVRLCQTGDAVIFHDENLKRIANRNEKIIDMDFETLSTVDVGSWFDTQYASESIPSLHATLEFAVHHNLVINLELKSETPDCAPLIDALMDALLPHKTFYPSLLISSFSVQALTQFAMQNLSIAKSLLVEEFSGAALQTAIDLQCAAMNLDHTHLTQFQVHEIHSAGLKVGVYTVNDNARALTLRAWGVDTIMSDQPELILCDAV